GFAVRPGHGRLAVLGPAAPATTSATATAPPAPWLVAVLGAVLPAGLRAVRDGFVDLVQGEHLGGGHVGLAERACGARQPLPWERHQAGGLTGGGGGHR